MVLYLASEELSGFLVDYIDDEKGKERNQILQSDYIFIYKWNTSAQTIAIHTPVRHTEERNHS